MRDNTGTQDDVSFACGGFPLSVTLSTLSKYLPKEMDDFKIIKLKFDADKHRRSNYLLYFRC